MFYSSEGQTKQLHITQTFLLLPFFLPWAPPGFCTVSAGTHQSKEQHTAVHCKSSKAPAWVLLLVRCSALAGHHAYSLFLNLILNQTCFSVFNAIFKAASFLCEHWYCFATRKRMLNSCNVYSAYTQFQSAWKSLERFPSASAGPSDNRWRIGTTFSKDVHIKVTLPSISRAANF